MNNDNNNDIYLTTDFKISFLLHNSMLIKNLKTFSFRLFEKTQ